MLLSLEAIFVQKKFVSLNFSKKFPPSLLLERIHASSEKDCAGCVALLTGVETGYPFFLSGSATTGDPGPIF